MVNGPRSEEAVGAIVPNLGMCRGDDDRWHVVGVVDDLRQSAVGEPEQPEVFVPFAQNGCAGCGKSHEFGLSLMRTPHVRIKAPRKA